VQTPTPVPTATPAPQANETVYRALLIGNEAYSSRLNGPYNDLAMMKTVIGLSTIDGKGYASVTVKKDRTRAQILSDIAALASQPIDANDVTLFYYSGHGARTSASETGTGLVGVDGTLLNVPTLKSALDSIPGRVIVILDSCYSGMFISKSAGLTGADTGFNDAVLNAFRGNTGIVKKALTTTNYSVITASRKDETSVSVGFSSNGSPVYVGLATYYLAMGAGYDILNPASSAFGSDTSPKDGIATFDEVFSYADAKVDAFRAKYPSLGITQDMQYYTANGALPVFGRN
jgi:hypothetical protein